MNSRISCLVLLGFVWALSMPYSAHAQWPDIALPDRARAFPVMDSGMLNGVPTRIVGVASDMSASDLTNWFRQRLPQNQQIQTYPAKTVISAIEGRYLHTLVIEPLQPKGSSTLISTARLPTRQERSQHDTQKQRWLDQMPAGTQIISHHHIVQGNGRTEHLILTNVHPIALNLERAVMLGNRLGFRLSATTSARTRLTGPDRVSSPSPLRLLHPSGDEWVITGGSESQTSWLVITQISPKPKHP